MKKILFYLIICLSYNFSYAQLPPGVPVSVTSNQVLLSTSIRLDWTPPTGTVVGYKVYRKLGAQIDSARILGGTANNYVFNGLGPGNTYRTYMRAFRLKTTAPFDTLYSAYTANIDVAVAFLVPPAISIDDQYVKTNQIGLSIVPNNFWATDYEIEYTSTAGTVSLIVGSTIFQTITGLTPNTQYSFRMRARRFGLLGPWSPIIYSKTLIDFPVAPNLVITGDCPTFVNLQWSVSARPNEISSFKLERSLNGGATYDAITGDLPPSGRNITDGNAIEGKNILYRLYSINSTGSTPSNVVSVNTKSFVPPNPAFGVISDQGAKSRNFLTFRWTNGAIDTDCNTNLRTEIVILYKINNDADFKEYARVPPFQSNIKIDGLKPRDIVTIAIIAVSDKGKPSSRAIGVDTTAGPPAIPSNLSIIRFTDDGIGNPGFELKWKDNANDEDYFVIERSIDDINYTQIAKINSDPTFATSRNFIDKKIEEGVTYFYRIKAGSNTEGDSPYLGSIFGIIISNTVPNAPYGLVAKLNNGKVDLTWRDDSSKEDGFVVEKSSDGGVTAVSIAELGRNVTSFKDENVLPGKIYYYRVKAKNAVGSSGYSNIEIVTTPTIGFVLNTSSINIYPNPTFDNLNIKIPKELSGTLGKIKILDRNNRLVFSKDFIFDGYENLEVPMNNFPEGMYTIIMSNESSVVSKKIFKY
jgi:hypothetical protein